MLSSVEAPCYALYPVVSSDLLQSERHGLIERCGGHLDRMGEALHVTDGQGVIRDRGY
jgi:hypothetical protein